jgi:hypothetical protein
MLDALKRWIAGGPGGADLRAVASWARQHGALFKRARDDQGFVIDGQLDGRVWRLEWGPSQRSYIEGRELRLRMELGLSQDLQMLLLSRPLMETLERQTFEHYTAQMQTQIDVSTPEEMRWLAMFPKVALAIPKELKRRFSVVASSSPAAAAWIDGPLAERLAVAARGPLLDEPPLVLMTLRGRVYLRLELAEPAVAAVESMIKLFETAAAQAVRVGGGAPASPEAWPSSASTAWQTHLQPEVPED